METSFVCALVIGLTACVTDIRSRRIPNVLTFGGAAAALLFHTVTSGGVGLGAAVAGWLVGFLMMIAPFALGGLGGGDVKLLAALGAWLGPVSAVWVGLYAGIVGALMGLALALYSGYLRQALTNIWRLLRYWSVVGLRPLNEVSLEGKGPRMAYALPIFGGLLLAAWLQ